MAKRSKTGGRRRGTPNKATADMKALASLHGPAIIDRLAHLALNAESEQAQIAACRELLDRGYGKPAQAIIGDEDSAPVKTVLEVAWATHEQALHELDRRAAELDTEVH